MGSYRLLLAYLVALSHAGWKILGYNSGIIAVISFFLLSGFVMRAVIQKYYNSHGLILNFYLDRTIRILPHYLFYLALTFIWFHLFQVKSYFVDPSSITLYQWLANALLLPTGYYMFWGELAIAMPQSWSLGLELTFYLIIPWITLTTKPRVTTVIFLLSLITFSAAYLEVINTDHFSYRLLPGTLFIFLAGSFLHSRTKQGLVATSYITTLSFYLLILTKEVNATVHIEEVLLGVLIGLPIVILLRRLKPTKLDNFLGNLSYGVFLNHFLVIWFLEQIDLAPYNNINGLYALLIISTALAYLSFSLIEKPFISIRYKIRSRLSEEKPILITRKTH